MAQCLKVCLQVQLHKEVVNCGFADQADAGEGELRVRGQGRQEREGRLLQLGRWRHSLGSQRRHKGALHKHRQRQQLTQLHCTLVYC